MKKIIFAAVFCLFILSACKYGADNPFYPQNSVHFRDTNISHLTSTGFETLPSEYNFVVLTDIHYGALPFQNAPQMPDEVFINWLTNLPAAQKPKFCLILGDVVDYGDDSQYAGFNSLVSRIEAQGVKVFNSIGNHDLYNSGFPKWKANCYPHTSFYDFKTSRFSFYSLDTGSGGPGFEQLASLKSAFASDSNPKIIFTHYPMYASPLQFSMNDTTERNLMMSLFAKNNVKLYLCGHIHIYEKYQMQNFEQYAIPSFLYKGVWAVVNVNETANSYNITFYNKGNVYQP